MKYEVIIGFVSGGSKEKFESYVSSYLSDGWELAGGVSILKPDRDHHATMCLAQALVRR